MNESERKEKIKCTLEKYGETSLYELAKKISCNNSTVSRYLSLLCAEGEVTIIDETPYKKFKLKKDE